jgi:hypothetical protein
MQWKEFLDWFWGRDGDHLTEENIRRLNRLAGENFGPRRARITMRNISSDGELLTVPFRSSIEIAIRSTTGITPHFTLVDRSDSTLGARWIMKYPGSERVKSLLRELAPHVVLRDFLDASFALDFRLANGWLGSDLTHVARLVRESNASYRLSTRGNTSARKEVARLFAEFIAKVGCYRSSDGIIAMTSSTAQEAMQMPREIVKAVSKMTGIEDLSWAFRQVKDRTSVRTLTAMEKVAALEGAIKTNRNMVEGKRLILIDELYQSGITMNYHGMLLKQAGAREVYGLAAVRAMRAVENSESDRVTG